MALFELTQSYESERPEEWQRPTFKDYAAADISLAFFNGDEHAEWHTVDGKRALVILEEDDMRRFNAHWEWGSKGKMDDGLYLAHAQLYIKVEDYGPKPKTGKNLVLDGGEKTQRTFRILQCREEQGVYRMTLERVRQ